MRKMIEISRHPTSAPGRVHRVRPFRNLLPFEQRRQRPLEHRLRGRRMWREFGFNGRDFHGRIPYVHAITVAESWGQCTMLASFSAGVCASSVSRGRVFNISAILLS